MASLNVLLVGVTVVLAVLALLWLLTAGVGMGFKAANGIGARRAATRPVMPEPAPQADSEPDIPPAHLAVIAAAVATMIDAPHRIVRVTAPTNTKASWVLAGRLGSYARGTKV